MHLSMWSRRGGGGQGMGWGFDIFQKFAFKFPAHGQIIPVKCNQIRPPRAAHVKYLQIKLSSLYL